MTPDSHSLNPHQSEEPHGKHEAGCPLPMSHDRLVEASHFLREMEKEYHDPQRFRFNLNAYLSSLKAARELLQKEMERHGLVQEWNGRAEGFKQDDVLQRFTRARNATLHQSAIYSGSRIETGLFRGWKLKMALRMEVSHDRTSQEILESVKLAGYGLFVDEAHTAIAEQLGVSRKYVIRVLSEDEDVLRGSRRAFARMTRVMEAAHNMFELCAGSLEDEDVLRPEELEKIYVLLESDVDPTLIDKWGWNN